MKKFLLSLLVLISLCGCSNESLKKATDHMGWIEDKCEQYVIEETRYQNIWGVDIKNIDIEYVDKNLYNYKFFCQVIGGKGETFRYYTVEIVYDVKKNEIVSHTINDSYFYLW